MVALPVRGSVRAFRCTANASSKVPRHLTLRILQAVRAATKAFPFDYHRRSESYRCGSLGTRDCGKHPRSRRAHRLKYRGKHRYRDAPEHKRSLEHRNELAVFKERISGRAGSRGRRPCSRTRQRCGSCECLQNVRDAGSRNLQKSRGSPADPRRPFAPAGGCVAEFI